MARVHTYDTVVTWTGNRGTGTSGYRHYDRAHKVTADGPTPILGSSDPAFRGDPARWNPEQLLVAALSQCHMLQYLHLCAQLGIVVTDYEDDAVGTLLQTEDGGGAFLEVVLAPVVTITDAEHISRATGLHQDAHRLCFIANSVRTPVRHRPTVQSVSSKSKSSKFSLIRAGVTDFGKITCPCCRCQRSTTWAGLRSSRWATALTTGSFSTWPWAIGDHASVTMPCSRP